MSTKGVDLKDLRKRMEGAVAALKSEFAGLRTGRATASLVEPITVEAYGSHMPMTQVGTISVPEPRTISIQVWDKALVSAVERAIRESGLGVNPVVDGTLVRIPIPPLTQERRVELTKVAHKYAEQARVAIRNVRREGMDAIKKSKEISEDEQKRLADQVQKLTDEFVKTVDDALAAKDAEIMQV
ncbi:ribosome recycling factor [Amphiplicatus metriothermophilus]|uniref:Ribosome-recycling factor n=1 Tax=Amphiplicatus metriothermophilus TaxID=1519374 RepID=A0A239PQY3_9PROT|nr:ribosome recycling factor [Amphiplicatus metriothermophilus]MBB5518507.1 ribosome recycling factor [Amphiplicatus metriothermophilus]SNT72332.1 ribosome recycling factor [Amphiplicatus metriothermophilus]